MFQTTNQIYHCIPWVWDWFLSQTCTELGHIGLPHNDGSVRLKLLHQSCARVTDALGVEQGAFGESDASDSMGVLTKRGHSAGIYDIIDGYINVVEYGLYGLIQLTLAIHFGKV
jgi:hypothetical protein